MKSLAVFLFLLLTTACAGSPPFLSYSIAQTALKSARKSGSPKNAGVYWMRALNYYRKAEHSFRNRNYISARRLFDESVKWAEKAENISRFKMSTGEGV